MASTICKGEDYVCAKWFRDKGLGGLIEALQLFDASVRLAEWTPGWERLRNA